MKAKSGGAVMAHSLFVSQAAKGALRWFCVCILQHWSSCCAKYRDDRENINLNLNMATDVNSLQTSNASRQREKPFPFAIHSPTELQVISNHRAFLRRRTGQLASYRHCAVLHKIQCLQSQRSWHRTSAKHAMWIIRFQHWKFTAMSST